MATGTIQVEITIDRRMQNDSYANDAMTDFLFGAFIRTQRNYKRISVTAASAASSIITVRRWKELEHGVSSGATRRECESIAKVLGLDTKDVMRRAAGI